MTNPWLIRFAPRPSAPLRLFCFSYAGGGAAHYRAWLEALPNDVELCAVQLPGREGRLRESPMSAIDAIVERLLPALGPELDRPFVFFGHSMGAMVAFEMARELQRIGTHMPQRLIVSGRRAPHLPETEAPMHRLADDAFVAEIGRRYGGIPAEVLRHRDLLELLLPGLRADITAVETHSFRPAAPLGCPLSVFGGDADSRAPLDQLEAWRAHGAAGMRLKVFPGGHFYFADARVRSQLISEILLDLRQPHAGGLPSAIG